jgi:hypothetical protein
MSALTLDPGLTDAEAAAEVVAWLIKHSYPVVAGWLTAGQARAERVERGLAAHKVRVVDRYGRASKPERVVYSPDVKELNPKLFKKGVTHGR